MGNKYVGRTTAQREFVKKFNELTYANSRWQVWQDMIWLFATTISNAVDKRYFDERERTYLRIIGKYKPQEQAIFPELFAMLVMAMEDEASGCCDFLGELFMLLELNFSGAGQFFTPYDVCKAMAKMSFELEEIKTHIDRHGYISINDCACGAGATLIAAADVLLENGINYQQTALFTGQDLDATVALMCYIQLSLMGCAGYVIIGNTLSEPMTGHTLYGEPDKERCWYTPMYFTERWSTLRAIDRCRRFMAAAGVALSPAPDDGLYGTIGSGAAPESGQETAPIEDVPEAPTFNVTSDKRQVAGQLTMF